jgi:hypothetical protein
MNILSGAYNLVSIIQTAIKNYLNFNARFWRSLLNFCYTSTWLYFFDLSENCSWTTEKESLIICLLHRNCFECPYQWLGKAGAMGRLIHTVL